MSGVQETPRMPERTPMDPSKEAPASKLWAVYVSEAEKYDKSLVESWKSDMEGMLIFAGLFSASLTAFLIESYKTLVPDSGDSTVQLLSQIYGSSQLLQMAVHSLGLSLTCALIATLVEQWARDFLHKADMRSSPFIRARIFSYIPLLLHTSLFLFFAGLVAFLLPINISIATVAAVLSAVVFAAYALLTMLPRVLEALEAFSNNSPVIFSLKGLLKSRLAESLLYGSDSSSQGQFPPLRHPSLPAATAIAVPPEFLEAQVVDSPKSGFSEEPVDPFQQVLQSRISEAKLGFLAEFLDGMRPDFIPYRADETLRYLCDNIPTSRCEIHETHQIRFASGICRVFDSGRPDYADLFGTITNSGIFEPYFDAGLHQVAPDAPVNSQPGYAWLRDSSARSQVQETLKNYSRIISSGAPSVPLRIQAILAGFESLHTGQENW
ncbi:hypothetical protein B0H13DRAFT_2347803 [Mycena leptocephala]|nr:hypothetical protein B0H13DRAFT_2347803 [Mycena leptocephala]